MNGYRAIGAAFRFSDLMLADMQIRRAETRQKVEAVDRVTDGLLGDLHSRVATLKATLSARQAGARR